MAVTLLVEQELLRGAEQRKATRRDSQRSLALAALSTSLAEAIGDVDSVLDRIVRLIAEWLGDCAVIRLLDEDGTAMRVVAAHDPDGDAQRVITSALESAPIDITNLLANSLAVRDAHATLLTGEAFNTATEVIARPSRKALATLGVHTVLICPLRAGGRVIGTLGLWRRGTRQPHSERDQAFVQELADRAALAIENARLVRSLRDEVEERKRNEDRLRLTAELLQRADEKRRALMDHLVTAQEEERRRIALDVHDDSIQAMAAIGIRLQILRRRASGHEFADPIAEIEDTVTESIARLRGLLLRLDSSSVEKVGLSRALTRYVAEVFPEGHPRVRIRDRLTGALHGHTPMVLYRVAQEALNNAHKHANAATVNVTLSEADQGVLLNVQDDGVGFNMEDAARRALPGHLGMRSMHERAQLAGGWLTLESSPGDGTKVRCWVPTLAVMTVDGDEPAV
ncbi:MAG TPA: ATP-binding protein [Candidatus Dormibacteraeota bacterium]